MPTQQQHHELDGGGERAKEGECSGLFVRKPTQEFESAMAKGEERGEGEQEARVKEREWGRDVGDDCGCFCFSGRRRSPSPLLLRRPRLQTELKRPRASLLYRTCRKSPLWQCWVFVQPPNLGITSCKESQVETYKLGFHIGECRVLHWLWSGRPP